MIRTLLPGQRHSLSYRRLERALKVRLDFKRFCGRLNCEAQSHPATVCRFRQLCQHSLKGGQAPAVSVSESFDG